MATAVEITPLDASYDALLAAVGAEADRIGRGLLTSHWPVVGAAFDRGVLVVGQAVFGWITEWRAADVRDVASRRAVLIDTKTVLSDRSDPMSWIETNRVRNSPFWRTAHEVVDALTPGPTPWWSRIAWTNLYPIAPNDLKANPGGVLLEAQTKPAAAVLSRTIDLLDPRLVLVLAGPFVWPFVGPLGLAKLEREEKPLLLTGRVDSRPWVVGWHPGGAQRRGWPARAYAELIVGKAAPLTG